MDYARSPPAQPKYCANWHEWKLFSGRREKAASCAQKRSQDTDLPSMGSVFHQAGGCRRCCFYPKGRCSSGMSCQFCHFDNHDKRKRLKKRREGLHSARTIPVNVKAAQKPTWVVIDLSHARIEPRKGDKTHATGHRRFDDIVEDFSQYARRRQVVSPTTSDDTKTEMAQIHTTKVVPSSPFSDIGGPRSESAGFCPPTFWDKEDGMARTYGHKAYDTRNGAGYRDEYRARSSSSSYMVCGKPRENARKFHANRVSRTPRPLVETAHTPRSVLEHQRRYAAAEAWRTYATHDRDLYGHYDPYYRYALAQQAYNYHARLLGYDTTWSYGNHAAARNHAAYYSQHDGRGTVGGVVGAPWHDAHTDLLHIERARRFSEEKDAHLVRTSDTSAERTQERTPTTLWDGEEACSDSHKQLGAEDRFWTKPNSNHTADTTASIGGKTEDKAAASLNTFWEGASVCSSSSIDEIVFLDRAMFRPCTPVGTLSASAGHGEEISCAPGTAQVTATSARLDGSTTGLPARGRRPSTEDTGALGDDMGAQTSLVETKSDSFWSVRSPEEIAASMSAHACADIDDGREAGASVDFAWHRQRQREFKEHQRYGSWNRALGDAFMKNSDANDSENAKFTRRCPDLPSVGSAKHFSGDCRRCCFFPKGRCTNGSDCSFCHFEHEKRKRQKKKKEEFFFPDELECKEKPTSVTVDLSCAQIQCSGNKIS